MEETLTAMVRAVAILANEVPNGTNTGRKAREEARKLIEEMGLTPPPSLGKSRQRKPSKKTRRRRAKTTKVAR